MLPHKQMSHTILQNAGAIFEVEIGLSIEKFARTKDPVSWDYVLRLDNSLRRNIMKYEENKKDLVIFQA